MKIAICSGCSYTATISKSLKNILESYDHGVYVYIKDSPNINNIPSSNFDLVLILYHNSDNSDYCVVSYANYSENSKSRAEKISQVVSTSLDVKPRLCSIGVLIDGNMTDYALDTISSLVDCPTIAIELPVIIDTDNMANNIVNGIREAFS